MIDSLVLTAGRVPGQHQRAQGYQGQTAWIPRPVAVTLVYRPSDPGRSMSSENHPIRGPLLSVNLGRNRTTATLVGADGQTTPVRIDGHDGVVTRWVGDPRTKRITDYLIELVDADRTGEARDLCSNLASVVVPAGHHQTPTVIAVPAAFGPICHSVVADGFSRHCLVETLVSRPLAQLSSVLETVPGLAKGPGLIVDNDGGEISILAIDPSRRLVFPPAPISTGPDDEPERVAGRLSAYAREVGAYLELDDLVVDDDPRSISGRYPTVVATGPGASQPRLHALIQSQLPASHLVVSAPGRPADDTVGLGPLHRDWAAGWPTAEISIVGSTLRILSPDGEPYPLRVGPLTTSTVRIPRDLVGVARARTLPDGRVLVLGRPGQRPLTMRVRWPLTSGSPLPLDVSPVGTRPIELLDPLESTPARV